MKQLTFAELAQMLQKATGKTQQATVDTLFDWAFKKRERVSQTSAHRYLNGESDIHKYVYKDGNDERDTKSSINKEIARSLNKQDKKSLSKELRMRGIKASPSKEVYPNSVVDVLTDQLVAIISKAEKTASSNFSKIPKNSQSKDNKKTSNKAVVSSLIRHISKLFDSRFPNSNEYKYAFAIYIANNVSSSTSSLSINVSKEEWQQIKPHIQKVPLLLSRTLYTAQDPDKNMSHPFSPLAEEQLPYHYDEKIMTSNIITKNGIEYYADKNNQPLQVNGKKLKRFYSIKEENPPIPSFVYIAEISNFNITSKTTNNYLTVTLTCNIIDKLNYDLIKNNHQQLGIPEKLFYNNSYHFEYIDNIDFLSRINSLMNASEK
ncbi:hypothetical protein [Limosilactobacillus antri]|uniref:hypothetical protein n=1 Tax=Limosilactobacillus antri TaxID=227943 RepID=UPI001F579322|nr:hypothetical protein [Limosilactobacillus antri]